MSAIHDILTRSKRSVRLALRKCKDCIERIPFCVKRHIPDLPYKITLSQPILPSSTLDEKLYNLRHVAGQIGDYVLLPGEVLSFWNVVGNPDKLKSSRSIRNNKVAVEKGGGLCQAAGAIYHLALLCGLEIVERYNHSVDLYGDGPRACPIGFDATVSYGYKDLRIRNISNATLRIVLSVSDEELYAELHSDILMQEHKVASQVTSSSGLIVVNTYYSDTHESISENIYRTL